MGQGLRISNVIFLLFQLSHSVLCLKMVVVNSKFTISLKIHHTEEIYLVMALHCLVDSNVKQFTFRPWLFDRIQSNSLGNYSFGYGQRALLCIYTI